MNEALISIIKSQFVRRGSLRLKPCCCTAGKLTIGVGRNLDDCGISQKEAYALLNNDIRNCKQQLCDEIPVTYSSLDELRQFVLQLFSEQNKSIMTLSNWLMCWVIAGPSSWTPAVSCLWGCSSSSSSFSCLQIDA